MRVPSTVVLAVNRCDYKLIIILALPTIFAGNKPSILPEHLGEISYDRRNQIPTPLGLNFWCYVLVVDGHVLIRISLSKST